MANRSWYRFTSALTDAPTDAMTGILAVSYGTAVSGINAKIFGFGGSDEDHFGPDGGPSSCIQVADRTSV